MNATPATDPQNAIEVRGVTKRFGRVEALKGVDLDVPKNSIFALLGPNGAGKSTLIDILCTIRPQDKGTAMVAGFSTRKNPLSVRRNIGVVFQNPTVDSRLSVRENLDFHGMVYQMPYKARKKRLIEVLELVDLSDWIDATVGALSGGMKRRLEIARALMHEPRILFMDEPTVGLDAQSRAAIWDHLDRLRTGSDLTVVVTTHYIDEVDNADRVCIIDKGLILANDTPQALKEAHGTTTLRLRPASAEAAAQLNARFTTATKGAGDTLVLPLTGTEDLAALMGEIGPLASGLELHQPSLESVFLGLTGRDLREAGGTKPARRGGRNG
ncbi:daunorubicin resistance ABC transporter ATPase subunit [Ketogulonicigenium robustum]|uniref:Daunorubicin resistance ABC transporter ATPase subunit n=1 Tax=Ketogulonicigenium robustum TaxID=92947 RepID=A0A1W6P252_9RHOB|nr:ABC transporter ATP-binding protein [Ketogulonicigenium robustum]ARO15598.1 daunorubicin resistance ABC transporter ATPase subunit [Ketogulonicigenium robustum]